MLNLILLYANKNRYSLNALLGALESTKIIDKINILFAKNTKEIFLLLDESSNKNIVALSFLTEQKNEIYNFISNLKQKYGEKVIIIAGGAHTSALPKEVILAGADYAVKGEGENIFSQLIKNALDGNFPEEKILIENSLIDINKYLPFSKKFLRFGPIEITRGCPYACKFCQTSFLFGTKLRHRDISQILLQVKEMAKIGLKDIRFLTPNAMSYGSDGKKNDIKAIEEMLCSVKKCIGDDGRIFFGTFPSEIRPEDITDENLNILKKYIYNRKITIGIQTASDKLLKKINRGHTLKDAINAIETLLKHQFTPILDFIFGLPEEDEEDLMITLEFIEKYSKKGAIIHTHTFTPLPGTPYANFNAKKIPEKLKIKIKHLENQKLAFGKWEKNI